MTNLKREVYLTKMSDGAMFRVNSSFRNTASGVEYVTLWGHYVGREHLPESMLLPNRILRPVSWEEEFTEFIKVRVNSLDWEISRQIKQLKDKYDKLFKEDIASILATRERGSDRFRQNFSA